MAGAIAGTALVNYAPNTTTKLSTVTLTINNLCNLACPHCYLQYSGSEERYIGDKVLDHLYQADFNHLVIVGKEPFVNLRSVLLLEQIVTQVKKQGKTIGVITNGMGLDKLTPILAENLSYIDISFDGGELTYSTYRKGDFSSLINNIKLVNKKYNFSYFNALHVINDSNIDNLDDMLNIKLSFPFRNIMFSPYIETMNDGQNHVEKLSLEYILSTFSQNDNFLNTQAAFILLDIYHLIGDLKQHCSYSEFGEAPNMESIQKMITGFSLENKVKLIEKDPIHHGFVRLTYDGYMLSPYASLNPQHYKNDGVNIKEMSLIDFFETKSKPQIVI